MQTSAGQGIDGDLVARWSRQYEQRNAPGMQLERRLFGEIHDAVAKRGYFTHKEFMEVGQWKSPRSRAYLGRATPDEVKQITKLALGAPEWLRHRVLRLLDGVGVPMASALLTVADPTRFTVYDFRALQTLAQSGEIESTNLRYIEYVEVCRKLAERINVDLRTLDRALWQWSKDEGVLLDDAQA